MADRLLVCGGRKVDNRTAVWAALDVWHALRGVAVVIHGAQAGADTLADEWAAARGVERAPFPADWSGLGRRAGPIRNGRMLSEAQPTAVLAFPGGPGTADMVRQARSACVPVTEVG